jgi:hypothetical protein
MTMPEDGPTDNPVVDFEVHMIRAGREFLAATKSLIEGLDAALEALEQRAVSQSAPPSKVQPIPIRRDA